jgi:type II secretory pathway pseudopilin PulG
VKRKRTGFTVVELLAALGIIALMVSLLIPALNVVRNKAKETKQKAQFMTISLALEAFKGDYGDFPRSDWSLPTGIPGVGSDYCGAQKLAEALVGWDLMGFHPKSAWRADGYDGLTPNGPWTYDPDKVRDNNNDNISDSFDERKGPYLERATASAFRLGNISAFYPGLYNNTAPLAPNTFVLCDVFGAKKVTFPNGKTSKAGAPILYYRANISGKTINEIYDARDNDAIVNVKKLEDGKDHPLSNPNGPYQYFYNYILDPKITAIPWPYRPDSYILISAGADGLYGTGDDVRNFGN